MGGDPRAVVAEDDVEDDEQFPGTGGDGDLGGFAGLAEPLVDGAQDRVIAGADEGGHVEHAADPGAAAPAVPAAAPLAAPQR